LYSNAIEYCEEKSCKTERWNYFKGDYTSMNTFLQCDWNDILKGKNAGWAAV
jgi:hypothetical protein